LKVPLQNKLLDGRSRFRYGFGYIQIVDCNRVVFLMTDTLFHKVLWITDLHFGRSGNSPVASQDTLEFLDWAIERGRSWGAETMIFGGDYFDNRNTIGVLTLNNALQGLEKINAAFKKTYVLVGNHDAPYREKRDFSSVEIARNLPNIELIRDPVTMGDVTFLPWLVGDEPKTVKNLKSRYVFGHLELANFKMNAAVVLPDSPHLLKADQFQNQEFIFSGHFHIRQQAGRVIYTGSGLCQNFSDNWDEDRGIMLLEWGRDPIFEAWADQPVYRTTTLSKLLDSPGSILKPKATIRATMDVPLHYEEMQEIRDALQNEYGVRKFEIVPMVSADESEQSFKDDRITFKSVDQMVIDGIMSVESETISPAKLAEIYRSLAS
jgi:hypothetical protein